MDKEWNQIEKAMYKEFYEKSQAVLEIVEARLADCLEFLVECKEIAYNEDGEPYWKSSGHVVGAMR